ncbi:MAG: RNA methyltransferase [Calditrichaeota bacterium]|nr:MAG: RNA methyltransferase [Calditrichota bacterium]
MLSKKQQKSIRQLHSKKFRRLENRFLVEGFKCCTELLRSDFEIELLIKVENKGFDFFSRVQIEEISEKEFRTLSTHENPEGILAVAKIPDTKQFKVSQNENLVLLLDGISDPGNLGTIFRTASWFGVTTILLSENCVEPFNPKVVRATMGAIFHLNFLQTNLENEIPKLKENDFRIVGTSLNEKSVSLQKLNSANKNAILIGSESHGISKNLENLSDSLVKINSVGETSESLNVGVATGIILHWFSK